MNLYVKIVGVLSLTCTLNCSVANAQTPSDVFNAVTGVAKSVSSLAALAEWKKLPSGKSFCIEQYLGQQGSSVSALIQQGITPSDSRIASIRALCRSSTNPQAQRSVQSSIYVVDGLPLGGQLSFDSDIYRSYNCVPSEQFFGFTWCQRKSQERDIQGRGQLTSSFSILHSQDGSAFYINHYLEPAWFSGNEANDDIKSRTKKLGAPARIIPMPQQSSVPNGMIVVWGNVILEPLDPTNVSELAAGHDVRAGLMIDHIGNFQRSAQQGLPIYRLIGGAGYVWAASWNQAVLVRFASSQLILLQ